MAQHFLQILFIIAMLNGVILIENNLRRPSKAFDFGIMLVMTIGNYIFGGSNG